MPLVVEVAVVVASVAVAAIAVAAVRAIYCVERATNEAAKLSGDIQLWVREVRDFTVEARGAMASAREVIPPVRRVVDRFESLGQRAADLSHAVLEEVEPPLRIATAIARGMRAVRGSLWERLSHRIDHRRSATQKGTDHEGA